MLGIPELCGSFRYSAVLGDSSPQRFAAELTRYRQARFSDFKLKLSGNRDRDNAKMAALQAAGIPSARIRADANNLWRPAGEAISVLAALPLRPFALEEPLTVAQFTRPNLRALEGAFGTHLLARDVVAQPILFGAGGGSMPARCPVLRDGGSKSCRHDLHARCALFPAARGPERCQFSAYGEP